MTKSRYMRLNCEMELKMTDNALIYNEIIERINNAAENKEALVLTADEVRVLAEEIGDYVCVPLLTTEDMTELVKQK